MSVILVRNEISMNIHMLCSYNMAGGCQFFLLFSIFFFFFLSRCAIFCKLFLNDGTYIVYNDCGYIIIIYKIRERDYIRDDDTHKCVYIFVIRIRGRDRNWRAETTVYIKRVRVHLDSRLQGGPG